MKLIKNKPSETELNEDIFPVRQESHRLRSRRDFFAQGFYSLGAYVALPSLASVALEKVALAGCSEPTSSGRAGMLCFDLAGGWLGAGSNVIVGKNNSQLNFLSHYRTNGLPDALHPQGGVDEEFGLRFHPNSGFLAGLKETTSASTRQNIDGAVFTTISMDDSTNNTHSPVFAISKAAERGKLAGIIGTNPNNITGARAKSPSELVDIADISKTIRNPTDAESIVQLGRLTTDIFAGDVKSAELVLNKIKSLSNSRLAQFDDKDLPRQLREVLECGYMKASDIFKKYDAASLNPEADSLVQSAFNLNQQNIFGNNGNMSAANINATKTIAKMILDGIASVGTVVLGGYDYHNQARSVTDGRDYRAGKLVGASLELAAQKGENLCIYIYSDGAIATGQTEDSSALGVTKYQARSDSGTRSVAIMLTYGAHGRPEIRNEGRQVGSFNEAGGVDRNFNLITNSTVNLTKAVVANYLALHGSEDQLNQYVENNPFGADLDKYLVFGKFKKGT